MSSEEKSDRKAERRRLEAELAAALASEAEYRALSSSLSERVETLERDLAAVRADDTLPGYDALPSERERVLALRIAELETRHAVSEDGGALGVDEIVALAERVVALEALLAAAADRESVGHARVAAAERLASDAGIRLAELGEAADATRAQVDAARAELEAARAEVAEVRAQVTQRDEALTVTTLERDGARAELDRGLGEIKAMQTRVEELTEADAAGRELREALERDVATARAAVEDAEAARDAARAEIADARTEAAEMRTRAGAAEEAIAAAQGAAAGAAESEAAARAELATIGARLEEARAERDAIEQNAAARVAELEAALGSVDPDANRVLETRIAELETEGLAAESRAVAAEAAVARMREEAAAVQAQLASVYDVQGELKSTAENEAAGRASAESRLERLQQEHEALVSRFDELQAAHGTPDPTEAEAVEAIAELELRLADAETRATEGEARAADAEAKLGAATAQLGNLEQAHEILRARVEELQAIADGAPGGGETLAAPGSDAGASDELAARVAELETMLEQSEARARSAYTAAEAAEATLRLAKEQRLVPSMHTDEEFANLKNLLEEATRKAENAERDRRTAEADLEALRAGVDPDAVADPLAPADPRPERDAWAAGERTPSLRSRLAGAAASKKSPPQSE